VLSGILSYIHACSGTMESFLKRGLSLVAPGPFMDLVPGDCTEFVSADRW